MIAVGGLLLVGADLLLWVAWALVRLLPLLLAIAAVVVVYRLARRRRRAVAPPRVVQGRVLPGRASELKAENADLRARLADAEESARLAWDAAASVPPRPARSPSTARDRLLAVRLGGVHDLFGSEDDR